MKWYPPDTWLKLLYWLQLPDKRRPLTRTWMVPRLADPRLRDDRRRHLPTKWEGKCQGLMEPVVEPLLEGGRLTGRRFRRDVARVLA